MRYFFESKVEKKDAGYTIQIPFNVWEVCHQREGIKGDIVLDNNIIECELHPKEKGNYEIEITDEAAVKVETAPAAIPATGIYKVVVIAKLARFEVLKKALNDLGVTGMTMTQVMGCGVQKGAGEMYRGVEMDATLLPKVKVEVVVRKIPVATVI